jgi:MFS transporter, ACS family, hexuronate transporter
MTPMAPINVLREQKVVQSLRPKTTAMRWWILVLLFLATVLNYVDRQSLSLLASTIQHAFRMDDIAYGNVVAAFLLAYTIGFLLAGPLCDRLGARLSTGLFICWWSLAELIPPFTHSVQMLGVSRFLLGIGEAGVWVAAPKAVAELFSKEQRALVIGIYTAGATVGAVIAPPSIALLAMHFGWQSVFFITGVAGLIWLIPWLLVYRDRGERDLPRDHMIRGTALGLKALLAKRNLWLLTVIRMVTDPLWYFFLFWYPKYLTDLRQVSLTRLGHIVWIVYLAADVGSVVGGWASGRLIHRHMASLRARRTVMTIAGALILLTPLVALSGSANRSIAVASIVTFGHMAWLITLGALVVDLFPQDQVATAFGLIAAGSGIGGLVSTQLIAHSLGHSGYLATFCILGTLHPVALIAVYLLRDSSHRTALSQKWPTAAELPLASGGLSGAETKGCYPKSGLSGAKDQTDGEPDGL